MPIYRQLAAGTPVTLLSTELNGVAPSVGAVSTVGGTSGVFDNTPGTADLLGYPTGLFELYLAAPSAAFAPGAINVYFLRSADGTNFEDGGSSVFPKRLPDLTFYPRDVVTTAQRIEVAGPLPVGKFKVLLATSNLGVALAASGNTLKALATTARQSRPVAGSPVALKASGASAINGAAVQANDADIDNTSGSASAHSFELVAGFGGSVVVNGSIDLYLVPKLDGTNAAAADTSTPVFQPSHYAGTFVSPTNGTATRRMTVEAVACGPYRYVPWLVNRSGQTLSSGWTLTAYPEL